MPAIHRHPEFLVGVVDAEIRHDHVWLEPKRLYLSVTQPLSSSTAEAAGPPAIAPTLFVVAIYFFEGMHRDS